MRDDILTAGHAAKAYHLARMPANTARMLWVLWMRPITEDVALFGGPTLYACESAAGAPVPTDLANEDRLILMSLRSDLDSGPAGVLLAATALEEVAITEQRFQTIFRTPGSPTVEVWQPDQLLSRLEHEEQAQVLRGAIGASQTTASRSRGTSSPSNSGRSHEQRTHMEAGIN